MIRPVESPDHARLTLYNTGNIVLILVCVFFGFACSFTPPPLPRSEFLASAEKSAPQSPVPPFLLGQRALSKGQWSRAEKYFKHAVSLQPAFSEAVLGLAHAQRENSKLSAALKSYRQARSLQPDSAAAAEGEGLTLYLKRDFAGAEKALSESLSLEPNRPQAAACLGDCLLIRGDLRGALNNWKVALDHGANIPRLKSDYADLAAYLNKYGTASDSK